ncbi:MAG: ketopantoate reductase PanE/ApbA C terminal-domain-containing protein [Piptocephalis tieghemiana]|nr:MAG: ketopantoate reductase PanE/ApbA C terminal-domain-containing protein [Piptocephalis tieghemiana]
MPPLPSPSTIHVLGGGAIGLLVAGHLLKVRVPVRLHLRRPPLAAGTTPLTLTEAWKGDGGGSVPQSLECPVEGAGMGGGPIDCLVVATKAQQARRAIEPLCPRLTERSKVLFLQNGLGVYEDVVKLWEREGESRGRPRPIFLLGTTTHGAYRPVLTAEGEDHGRSVVHAGQGRMWVGAASARDDHSSELQEWVEVLSARVPDLALDPTLQGAQDMQDRLVEKLAVASIILPLTALSGQKNGDILSPPLEGLAKDLAKEVSKVLTQAGYPRMLPSWVEERVKAVARETRENISSMRADIEAGRRTEVEFICGAIIRMAREKGLPTPLLDMLQGLIEARSKLFKSDT